LVFLVLIFFLHFIIGQIIENLPSKMVSIFFNLVLFALILFFSVGVTYTADWRMYYWFFKFEDDKTDFVYYRLTLLFKKWGLSFEDLFKFHIITINILYFFLIRRFTRNYFYVMLVFIVINYVHSVNQLRFFLGLPLMHLGFYYLFQKKKLLLAIPLFILGCLCHSALLLLLLLIPLYSISMKKYMMFLGFSTILSFIIIMILLKTGLLLALAHFGEYFDEGETSSFLGGLFNAMPYMIYLVFLYVENKKIVKKFPQYLEDKHYQYLYKLSFFPIIFIPPAFVAPVIGHRYVIAFLIIWVIFYLYLIKGMSNKQKFQKFLMFACVHILVACFYYIFPDYISKENHYMLELERMLKSANYLKSLIY